MKTVKKYSKKILNITMWIYLWPWILINKSIKNHKPITSKEKAERYLAELYDEKHKKTSD